MAVTKNPNSMFSRWKRGEISTAEYNDFRAQKRGFENMKEFKEHRAHQMGYKSNAEMERCRIPKESKTMHARYRRGEITAGEYNEYIAKKNGFSSAEEQKVDYIKKKGHKNRTEYANRCAEKKGFKDEAERRRYQMHLKGLSQPLSENKSCPLYLGVHIAERILSKIFLEVQRLPLHNKGYDFICSKEHKIDVKSACLFKEDNAWHFHIRRNKVADYFLLIAFDNRISLNPRHIWLISGTETIKTMLNRKKYVSNQLNSKNELQIFNSEHLNIFKEYELIDKLEKIKECCAQLRRRK